MRMAPNYLTGHEAITVARLLDLPLALARWHVWDKPSLGPDSAENLIERGTDPDEIVLDLTRMDWWTRWRVTWARIGCWRWLSSQLTPAELLATVGE